MANLIPVIEQVKDVLKDTKAKIADNGGWDTGDFADVYDAFIAIVMAVETAADEVGGLTEDEKKKCVAETLNWMIDLPWIPEALEGMAFNLVVSIVWEAAKKKFGPEDPPVVQ
jgi:hypothetical protein